MIDYSFKDKVAIVTGAGQGIGFAIAKRLAEGGARIILNDLDSRQCNEAVQTIRQQGGTCEPLVGDVSSVDVNKDLVALAVKKFGCLDIAIANAGITLYGKFLEYSQSDFDKVMGVNLAGSFFLAQAAAKQMKVQGRGKILFISSVTGHQAHKDLAAYGMSKAGIEMLARTLVLDLSPYKININAIAPGATITERTMQNPEYARSWSRYTPIGNAASVDDIANAALFLVSDQANHITGQTLVVDGGWTAISPSPE